MPAQFGAGSKSTKGNSMSDYFDSLFAVTAVTVTVIVLVLSIASNSHKTAMNHAPTLDDCTIEFMLENSENGSPLREIVCFHNEEVISFGRV